MDFYRGLLTPEDRAIEKQEMAEDMLRFKRQPEEPAAPVDSPEQPEENR